MVRGASVSGPVAKFQVMRSRRAATT